MANKMQVRISGQDYTLISDESREYMQEIADYIDEKMFELNRRNPFLSTNMAAVLVAINMADKAKKAEESPTKKIQALEAEISELKSQLHNRSSRNKQNNNR